jgi:short-subunit dehydrogenase
MAIELSGKPILITGASSGIGAATALRCAQAGMPVLLVARRADRLRETESRIAAAGGRAAVFQGDVADAGACAAAVEECIRRFGSIYGVYANAGYGVERAVHEMPDAEVRAMFETNFFGTLNTIRPALPHMLKARAGHVLICSSCVAKFALPYFSVYSATKAAQNHISRAMKLELEPFGVHVSSVHPVGTKTEFFDTAQKLSGGQPMIAHTSDFFMQSPDTVARATVRCLRSPRPEVWTSMFVQLGMAFSVAFPRLADMGVRGMVKQRMSQGATG